MKETREETYRKIFIKSEADLPKEYKNYPVHIIGTPSDITENCAYISTDAFKQPEIDFWLNNIDWYLQPQEKEKQTAEEWLRANKYTPDLMFSWEWVIRALTKYASQSQSVLPNEEEIEKAAQNDFNKTAYNSYQHAFRNGADWFKSQLEQGYPKEFVEWCIEAVDTEERAEVDYYYAVWNSHNVLGFETLDELYQYWIKEVKQ